MSAVKLPLSLLVPIALLAAACGGTADGPVTSSGSRQCSIPAACATASPVCLGTVDNAGLTRFGLRISQLDVSRPAGLTTGIVGVVVAADVLPANGACDLPGTGTFSWLLRFDTAAGTLETGGARPVADPADGYAFVDEEVAGWRVQPATFAVDLAADGSFSTPAAQDLVVPMYVDPGATELPILLPLRGVRFTSGALGSAQSCVGRYDVAALDPANDCFPDRGSPAFVDGASISGTIRLEDAEKVSVPAFAETLCAVLAGEDPATTVRDAAGILRCARDAAGHLVLSGDTCSTPGATCADAVVVAADFAASAVKIND